LNRPRHPREPACGCRPIIADVLPLNLYYKQLPDLDTWKLRMPEADESWFL